MNLDDIARLVEVHEAQLSPDGRRVAVVLETVDEAANELRRRLVVFDVDRPNRQRTIAKGKGRLGSPRWSPDGTRLAYLTDRHSKDDKAQLEVRSVGKGSRAPMRITAIATGVSGPEWAPDGERLLFLAKGADRAGDEVPAVETDEKKRVIRIRGFRHRMEGVGYIGTGEPRMHVWVIDAAAGAEPRQVTDGPFDDLDATWSPDGGSIAFASDRSPDADRHFGGEAIHVVGARAGAEAHPPRRISPEGRTAQLPSWSPGGDRIAYLRSDSPHRLDGHHNRLWVADVATGAETCWTADLDRSIGTRPGGYTTASRPAWAADGGSIVHLVADAGTSQLARITPAGVEWLSRDQAVVEEVSASAAGDRAIVLRTDPLTPSELWWWEAGSAPRRLAGFNDELDPTALRLPDRRTVTRPDGFAIDGWLDQARRTRPAPARHLGARWSPQRLRRALQRRHATVGRRWLRRPPGQPARQRQLRRALCPGGHRRLGWRGFRRHPRRPR